MPLPQPREGTTLDEFYRQLMQACPIIDGKILDCTFTVADGTSKIFPHGLGRPWRGAMKVASTAAGSVVVDWGAPFGGGAVLDGIFVTVNPAADITVRFWIY